MTLSECPLTATLAGHKHVNNIVKLLQRRYNLFNLTTGIIGSLYNILHNVRVRHGYSLCMLLGYALNKSVACMQGNVDFSFRERWLNEICSEFAIPLLLTAIAYFHLENARKTGKDCAAQKAVL